MSHDRFIYVTYIRTTAPKLWEALIQPEFTRQYWSEVVQESDWAVGSDWKLMIPDGRVGDSGKVLEFDPPRRLSVSWRNEFIPGLHEEGYSRCTYELETHGDLVRLTLTHEIDQAHRGGLDRLADDPLKPQESAGDGRRLRRHQEMARGRVVRG